MAWKSTGFSFYDKDGAEVRYPTRSNVPADLVKSMKLDEKGLVLEKPDPKPMAKKPKSKRKWNEDT